MSKVFILQRDKGVGNTLAHLFTAANFDVVDCSGADAHTLRQTMAHESEPFAVITSQMGCSGSPDFGNKVAKMVKAGTAHPTLTIVYSGIAPRHHDGLESTPRDKVILMKKADLIADCASMRSTTAVFFLEHMNR